MPGSTSSNAQRDAAGCEEGLMILRVSTSESAEGIKQLKDA
jgi:hypothetical protein